MNKGNSKRSAIRRSIRISSRWSAATMALVAAIATPIAADAQERTSPLAGAPAIRKRVELRDMRFEIGPGVATTLGQDYFHAIMITGRLGYHLSDWLALGVTGGFNLTPKYETSFHSKLIDALCCGRQTDRTPSQTAALTGMNRIGQVLAAQAELVPFTGKIGLFHKLFVNYDFYGFGGPGFINFQGEDAATVPECANGVCNPVVGLKFGANFGVGMHAFVNDFFAVNFELRDILIRNNPAGRDRTGDMKANGEDMSWDSNYMLGLNLMFFLPTKPPVSP